MDYLLTFLEGLASFASPCMIPMIPVYLSYFAGNDGTGDGAERSFTADENKETAAEAAQGQNADAAETVNDDGKKTGAKKGRALITSLFFVFGFTLTFVVFGGLVGFISGYIAKYKTVINIVAGAVVILFGLSYVGLFDLPFFKGMKKSRKVDGVWSAFLFGLAFAVGVGPCTGAFLGSALALASASGSVAKGVSLLAFYSMGIGIPFIITAVLTDKTKKLFGFIKRHFKIIKIVSGSLLVLTGVLMAAGIIDKLAALIG